MSDVENGKKKIWICLLTVVLAAVVIGLLYYMSTPQEKGGEGFLIRGNKAVEETAQDSTRESARETVNGSAQETAQEETSYVR